MIGLEGRKGSISYDQPDSHQVEVLLNHFHQCMVTSQQHLSWLVDNRYNRTQSFQIEQTNCSTTSLHLSLRTRHTSRCWTDELVQTRGTLPWIVACPLETVARYQYEVILLVYWRYHFSCYLFSNWLDSWWLLGFSALSLLLHCLVYYCHLE